MKRYTPTLKYLIFNTIILGLLIACRLSGIPELAPPAPSASPLPSPTPTTWVAASYQIITEINLLDGAILVFIPEGAFIMGGDRYERIIFLDSYWLYQVPVTNAQFAEFVRQTDYQTTAEVQGFSRAFTQIGYEDVTGAYWAAPEGIGSDIAGREDHPVGHMSWLDAHAYCEWVGGRLPTEAEWVKAGRGVDGRRYPWGNSPITADKANFCDINCPDPQFPGYEDASHDDGFSFTSPVGNYPAGISPYGALDMAGNVLEWVADWHDIFSYRNAPDRNPSGPETGTLRVQRGGYYGSDAFDLTLSREPASQAPDYVAYYYGFRCAMTELP